MLVKELMPPTPSEGIIFVNGEFQPDSAAKVSALDHGLMYGDGCFDAWCGRNGFVFQLDAHLDRLYRSVEGLKIRNLEMPKTEMRERIIETVHRNAVTDFYIKVLVTRGASPHPVIDPRKCGPAGVIIYARPQQYEVTPEKLGTGIRIKILALRKLSHEGLEPQIKSLNYLNNVMGKLEAWDAGYDEGMFLDDRGYACECPGFNISAIKGDTFFTPSRGILVGITRGTVMEMARDAGLNVETGFYTAFDFTSADEVMMTNTVAGIAPVTNIDGWPIGDGKPGHWTMKFQETYLEWLQTGRHGTQVFPEAWRD
ncbi:MAG TPA: aminotransferase class IV [Candidatus Deferrimicrobium sp.]|nr:aminotransferase class IV [Candidatus Deferrimicrobium sp.]